MTRTSDYEFLANMSPEICTPMNAILGMTKLVLATDLTLEQQYCLERVHNSSELGLDLLADNDFDAVLLDVQMPLRNGWLSQ